ncbi:MAG: peptide ABC transporter substrate-binding protein [Opitutaceae bacterium]|jgi:oligopeptide transport system substrate-binding protein|nr:peptide ABC transporter substrate-binding protein [Opitutaceae bacterium]
MRRAVLCILAVLCGAPTACRRRTPVDAALATQTLLVGNGAEPATLDPHLAVTYNDFNIVVALFEGLTAIDEATSLPVPAAAESWDVSPDRLTHTFRLRPGLLWSNGDPLTASDFVFSFQRILEPALAAEYASMLHVLRGARDYNEGRLADFSKVGVRADGPLALVLTLETPCPHLPAMLAHNAWFPVHPPSIRKFDALRRRDTPWTRPGNLVSNGPFSLAEWSPGRRLVVRKNPLHRDAPACRLENVVFLPNPDTAADERAFRAGQLHLTFDILPSHMDNWRRDHPLNLRADPFLETFYLAFNTTRPPLDNPLVRRALSLAIDRETIAEKILRGSRRPAVSLIPPGTAGYNLPDALKPPLCDFPAARELLAKAGYPDGRNFPKLDLKFNSDPLNALLFEAVQEMWRRELGVEISLTQLEYRAYIADMHRLDFDLLRSRWIGDFPDPSTFTNLFRSNDGNNCTGWRDAPYDALLRQAAAADGPERHRLLNAAEKRLLDEAPIAPIFFGARTHLIHTDVQNWVPSLLGVHRYQTLRLERSPEKHPRP